MFALYEDSGRFHAGRVMSESETSVQVELDSGKRVKVKTANVLLRFDKPAPAELFAAGQRIAPEIDLDLAWEFAPEGDFDFVDLARDYFEARAGVEKQAAALFRLFEAPHYFRRVGRGVFRKAPQETVRAALAAIERKRQLAAQIDAWAGELASGRCPDAVREQLFRILFKPDKQSAEYKAVVEATRRSQQSPLALLERAGAIDSPYQFHWRRFLFEQFPRGAGFPVLPTPELKEDLPRAEVAAFSIDDSHTTEIDDALSVQGLGTGTVRLGIHIAAPGLAIAPDSPLDKVARERLSTVYMPGWKLTMLPAAVVDAYTLTEGSDRPAVSLYVALDEATLTLQGSQTRLERVPVVANLRHDRLDQVITEGSLEGREPAEYPFAAELAFAFRLARQLKARREAARGKPETFNRPDFAFRLEGHDGEPGGGERVTITPRRRGAPLDLIVSEAMILANSTWGAWLAAFGVPGIYRTQASLAPGNKVRMGTRPAPHAGLGVPQYAWSTSPLRRYVDLVNQWQIIACARHGRTAALAAPFKPKDATLFALISQFDATYTAYNDFQAQIERFWTLRWLQQNGVTELDAMVMRDGLVRADAAPLVLRATGTESLPRGTHVRVRVTGSNLLSLDAFGQLLTRLDQPAPVSAEEAEDVEESEEAGLSATAAGPITLAIDLADEAPLSAALAAGAEQAAPPT
jgi:exoribonuclease-2